MLRRLETTSLPIPHPCHLSRHLARHEHVDELHTEPARHDARDRPDVACAWRRQVKPRAFGRPVVPTSPQPPPGAAIVAHAFVSSSAHAMSTPLTASQPARFRNWTPARPATAPAAEQRWPHHWALLTTTDRRTACWRGAMVRSPSSAPAEQHETAHGAGRARSWRRSQTFGHFHCPDPYLGSMHGQA